MKDNHYLRSAVQDYIKADSPDVAGGILDEALLKFTTEVFFDLCVNTLNDSGDSEGFRLLERLAHEYGDGFDFATYLPMLRARLEKLTLQRLPPAKAETKHTAKRL